ncbi:hypothetical protein [Labilibaculum antarcticum]|uniref:Uncharacterized protein n=1 Tax=Labilibaculum antarcticum TaxID=1717717 RepID=A0A1Y1CQC8_9BACT|nr:hypothetical protein [Labilibaculum antarcticum]BAX82638.1 hypothetical protein ALGA_4348 [Labilibaculum antarcticum]
MIVLRDIIIKDNGRTVLYDYTVSKELSKYFRANDSYFASYDIDVSSVPKSILCIPFMSNFLPIAWFLGVEIKCKEIDKIFYESAFLIKKEFQKMYPKHMLGGDLQVESIIENSGANSGKKAMLFSGGVDAVSVYVRHAASNLALFSIWGADIELNDKLRWSDLVNYNDSQKYLAHNPKYYIKSNLRDFYTSKLDLDLDLGWWGYVQHGMALLGVTAPLAYILGIETLYIASSHTKETQLSWGSNPTTDELLKWTNTKIVHECYDLTRVEKVKTITDFSINNKIPLGLRVCYSERRDSLNCSVCEKCIRTIMAIVLCGDDPNKYGFRVDSSFYVLVKKLLKTGIKKPSHVLYWKDLQVKAKQSNNVFVFENPNLEMEEIKWFLEFDLKVTKQGETAKGIARFKAGLINKYPNIFKFYMNIRLKFVK